MAFWSDLRIAVKEMRYIKYLSWSNRGDGPYMNWPEDKQVIRGFRGTIAGILSAFVGDHSNKPVSAPLIANKYMDNYKEDEIWIFVNGIMTDTDILKNNGEALNYIFRRPIHLYHNPTRGFINDIAEVMFERTFEGVSDITRQIYVRVLALLNSGTKVRLIGHSQGTIILSAVMDLLLEANVVLAEGDLEVYCLAGADRRMAVPKNTHIESFANELDYVARIGTLAHDMHVAGPTYIRKGATGHLLNCHYLPGLVRGSFGTENKLFDYVDPKVFIDLELSNR